MVITFAARHDANSTKQMTTPSSKIVQKTVLGTDPNASMFQKVNLPPEMIKKLPASAMEGKERMT